MTVLWILLGVLAAIILLLCLPLTLRLSWPVSYTHLTLPTIA